MSYVAPNTDIVLLKGVPLDKDYNHSLRHNSKALQSGMFYSFKKYEFNNQSYQRAGKNKLRIAMIADNLYDCNYLMFRNTAYGDRWFYAFIDSLEYINNNTTEISYTIDVFQTWYWDYTLTACFVEREHTISDKIGENLIHENIDTGELIPQNTWEFVYPTSISPDGIMYELVVFYVPNNEYISGVSVEAGEIIYETTPCVDSDGNSDKGCIVNGIYMGCKYWGVPFMLGEDIEDTRKAIDNLINKLTELQANIINMVQVPFNLWTDWIINGGSTATRDSNQYVLKRNYNAKHSSYYTPKNNKLYSYPFRNILVSNNAGQTATYKWEYFTAENSHQKQATFKVTGVPIMSPELMCYPHNYRGIEDDYENGLVLTDFPTPPWSEDSFAKWWAQHKESYILSLVSTAVVAAGSIAGTAAIAGASATALTSADMARLGASIGGTYISAGTSIVSSLGNYVATKNAPDQISGQASVSSLRTVQNRIGFKFYDMGLEKEKAKVIDDYFNMFGYAINEVKVPNLHGRASLCRPHWNYIKTKGCILAHTNGSSIPADDEEKLRSIYDNGITIWNLPSEIGDYSLDNSPVVITDTDT